MTRNEIQLVVFLALALLLGAGVQWWRAREVRALAPPEAAAPPRVGWENPPYVFKNAREMREEVKRLEE